MNMTCPRCGQPLAPGARLCANCGQAFVPAGSMPQGMPQPGGAAAVAPGQGWTGVYVPPPAKRWPWVVGSVLAAVLALAGLQKVGLLRLGSGGNGSHLQANAGAPNPVLHQGAGSVPPILGAPDQAPPSILAAPSTAPAPILRDAAYRATMPKDIEDWLKWLEKIEKDKRSLAGEGDAEGAALNSQLKGADGMNADDVSKLTDPDNSSDTAPGVGHVMEYSKKVVERWMALDRLFWTRKPPVECEPIAKAFSTGLLGIASSTQQVNDLLAQAAAGVYSEKGAELIKEAEKILAEHKTKVDEPLSSTDQLVQQICDKYDTKKWFWIDAHDGSGSALRMMGG